MLKIVVFDGGWGGEIVASYLRRELEMVEVIKAIDWRNIPYEEKSLGEIYILTKKYLAPYIGKVDLIVLGGYTVSTALGQLQAEYPQQNFISVGISYKCLLNLRQPPKQIALLCDGALVETSLCDDLQEVLPESTLIIPDTVGWEQLLNMGEMTSEILRWELQEYFALRKPSQCQANLARATRPDRNILKGQLRLQVLEFLAREHSFAIPTKTTEMSLNYDCPNDTDDVSDGYDNGAELAEELLRPDTILLLNTHYWDIKDELQDLFGPRVRIMDFRAKLLHDVCLALGLRGVDGLLGVVR